MSGPGYFYSARAQQARDDAATARAARVQAERDNLSSIDVGPDQAEAATLASSEGRPGAEGEHTVPAPLDSTGTE